MELRTYAVLFVVGWLIAWLVSHHYSLSTMNRLLDYLRESKENRFLEVTGGGSYVPFWKRPPWGYYDTIPYVFSNKDMDDEIACKLKSTFKKAIILHIIVVASFFLVPLLSGFAQRD